MVKTETEGQAADRLETEGITTSHRLEKQTLKPSPLLAAACTRDEGKRIYKGKKTVGYWLFRTP